MKVRIVEVVLAFSCLLSPTLSSPVPNSIAAVDYDVIIIGGGPAGLSALSGLSRVRRKAVMLDSGMYRNAATRHMHDVIGNDGTVPAAFRALARQQISRYQTATMLNATVTSIARGQHNGSFFTAVDSTGRTYTGRKVVLATGLVDVLPTTPGVAEIWSQGLYWCPWCDGFEHRDQPFGILGPLRAVLHSVLEMESLNADIIAFVNGTYTTDQISLAAQQSPTWLQQLAAYNVTIDNRTIASIDRLQDGAMVNSPAQDVEYDEFRVRFTDNATVLRSAFIGNFPSVQRSMLGVELGVAMVGNKMLVDADGMRTQVAGVFAVGDANSDNSTNVPHAMWSGKRAAVAIHVELEEENSLARIARRDIDKGDVLRRMGRDVEQLWSDLS